MRTIGATKWNWLAIYAGLALMAAAAASGPTGSVFQMKLVVAEGSEASPAKDAERIDLVVTNSATGHTRQEVLWVGKAVLIDQNDIETCKVVTTSDSSSNVPGKAAIEVTFTPEGRKRFAEVTRQSIDKRLAIIINGRLISAPVIKSEIPGGKAMITGNFSTSEAEQLNHSINEALKK